MDKMILNLGPQHPSTHGVLRLILELYGEKIISAEPDIGYLHRSLEKTAEFKSYIQYLPMVDRIDYLSGFFYSYLFCNAVEQLAEIEVPQYAKHIRVMMMELNRISSHLLWLGTYLLDLGAISPMFYTFREREAILSYFEKVTGQRMMYNYFIFGGVRHNLLFLDEVDAIIKQIYKKLDEYEELISNNPIFISRTQGIGIITPKAGISYGLTGVNLRGSGVILDHRYYSELYDDFEFNIILGKDGDCYSRYIVRLNEMRESLKIISQCVEYIKRSDTSQVTPQSPINIRDLPTGEVYSYVEAPRGLSMCYLNSVGEATPYRVKWRTASYYSTQFLKKILKDTCLQDLISIYGSLDVVLPEVDR